MQASQTHLTEEEIVEVAFGEATFLLRERSEAHSRECIVCRELIRFYEEVAEDARESEKGKVLHTNFEVPAATGERPLPEQPVLAMAAESPEPKAEVDEAVPFAGLNAVFRAVATGREHERLLASLVEPTARRWFRACHALVHGEAQEEPCSAELLDALGSLPTVQCQVARMHHAIAVALREEGRSIEQAAGRLEAIAREYSQPRGLVLDIAEELLTTPALLREMIAAPPHGAPWHGNLRPPEKESRVSGILLEKRAGGEARDSIAVFVTVELVSMRKSDASSLQLYPVPTIALWDRDAEFRNAEESAAAFCAPFAAAYAATLMPEPCSVEVRWRLSRHLDGSLPGRLLGGSMGFVFAFLLRRLFAAPDEPIARVNLSGVAISGGIAHSGEVLPVGGIEPKVLHHGAFHTLLMPVQPIGELEDAGRTAGPLAASGKGGRSSTKANPWSTPGGEVHVLKVADVESGAAALELEHQTRWQGFDFDLPEDQPDFVGRVELTTEVLRFVRETHGGYGVVAGGMGCGKTAFMKQLIRRLAADGYEPVFYVVPSQPGVACRGENLAKKLYFHLRRTHLAPEPPEWAGWEIVQRLSEHLKYLGERFTRTGRKTVIVIDAADQVELPAGMVLVPDILPAELPPGVVCIISSDRRLKWLRDPGVVTEFFGIGTEPSGFTLLTKDRDDVLRYLRRQQVFALPESLIEAIVRYKEPPVFFTVVKRLAELSTPTLDAEKRKNYLEHPKFWASPPEELVRRRINTIIASVCPDGTGESRVWDTFGVLAVVREPVCEEELGGLGLWKDGLTDVILTAAASFFAPAKLGRPRHLEPFRFDHQSYPLVILDKIEDSGKVRCHRMIAESCLAWRRLKGLARRYALRNAPAHLRRAGMWDELYELLTDFDFLVERMKQARSAPGSGFQPVAFAEDVPQQLAAKVLRDFDRALNGQPSFPEDHRWRPAIEALHQTIEESAATLHEAPALLVQQLYNTLIWDWSGTDLGHKLDKAMRTACRIVFKRRRRPAAPPRDFRRVVFKGHRKSVNCVALSPDEAVIASASADKTVFLWHAGTGEILRVLREHTAPVTSVAWSPGGRLLASLAGEVRLWKPETGECVATLPVERGSTLAFSPREELLAVGGHDGSVRMFSSVDYTQVAVLRERGPAVRCMAFSSDGRLLAAGTGDDANVRGTVELFDVTARAQVRTLPSLPYWVCAVAFCPGDKMIATGGGGERGEVKLFSVEDGGSLRTLGLHRKGIFSLAISRNGVLATGSYDFTVGLHDLDTAAPLRTGMAHCEVIRSVAISRDGQLVVSAGADHAVIAWHLGGVRRITAAGDPPPPANTAHDGRIHAVRFSPRAGCVSTGSEDGTARLYSEDSISAGPVFKVTGQSVSVSVISPDETKIAVASNGIVRIFDVATGAELRSLLGHESWVLDLAWTPDSSRIVSVSEDTMAIVWDAGTGAPLHTLKGHTARLRAVAISPDGRQAATAGDDARIHIWNIEDGQLLRTLHGHEARIKALDWSQQGILASAGGDDFIKFWDTATGRELGILEGLSDEIWTLRFAPSRFLAAGGKDGIARLFDLDNGRQVAAFPCADAVQALWFNEDGTVLYIADRGGAQLIPNIHVVEIVLPARN